MKKFSGSSILNYFKDLYSNKLIFSIKEQKIKLMIKGCENLTIKEFLLQKNIILNDSILKLFNQLNLNNLIQNKLNTLSGGELQKLLCWTTIIKKANVYIFD